MTETEAQLEQGLVERLAATGWTPIRIRDEVDLLGNLKAELEAFNRVSLTANEFERVLNHLDRGGVFDRAKTLRDRYELTREDGSRLFIEFFDSREWARNRYQVVQQLPQTGSYKTRYDVTLLVNGLPLVQVELKRRGVEIKEAFNQVNRYHRHSYSAGYRLFQYIQIFVISNGVNTRYYGNNRKQSFRQTFTWSGPDNLAINALPDFADAFLDRLHVAKMISRYMVLHQGDRQLMVLRPYQYYAVEAILERVRQGGDGGYVWHTTGSGKTLTSFAAAKLITDLEDVSKVVFVVDRADLDYQTTREFNAFSEGSVDGTHNTHTLVRQFTDNTKLIVTTIQKLNTAISRVQFLEQMRALSNQRIVFIFDECHRSQFGETHKRITSFFSDHQLFGFTGTPILKENANRSGALARTTSDLFGDCLHKYVITDAIRDGNVLRFSVEYWGNLRRRDGSLVDEQVAGIDKKEFFEDPDRIGKIADWIIANHARKTHDRDFTAMLAVGSVDALIAYYEAFRARREKGLHDLRVVTIFTYGANEDDKDANGLIGEPEFELGPETPQNRHTRDALESCIADYNEMYGTAFSTRDSLSFYNYYRDIGRRIKHREREDAQPADRVDILLVVGMFLTGFDAKKVNTLYVDKNLQYHGLIQAYSRTNRVLNEVKSQGNIIAFRNLKKSTDEAIRLFADKNAEDKILIPPYQGIVADFNNSTHQLLAITPAPADVDRLADENEQLLFIRTFRELARLRNVLSTFAEFDWGDLELSPQAFDEYRSKYADLYELTRRSRQEGVVSIVGDVDFELELIRQDRINVAYILQLLRDIKDEESRGQTPEESRAKLASALDMISGDVQLRSKRELIEKFVQNNMPPLQTGGDVQPAFRAFWSAERSAAIEALCADERLDRGRFEALLRAHVFSHVVMREDVAAALEKPPSVLMRRKVVDRVLQRMDSLVRTFDDDLDGIEDPAVA
ncbi:type I restriction endonuclease subunit R [Phenylobacterium deserti]|uniref:Type I restriction enzyme endonuclease subunit n=1 Tax=Phenylobacterium deserti TaxID=1914756 RepID=A0A328AA72_9CAUL|nr:type I restriction endonuclease subunit R [Phenylobacterium deserti]RAK51307.1 type I restriction endonuclease subunit R [Phenylobacterium deserti]